MPRFFKTPIHYQGGRQIFSVDGSTRTPAPEVNDNDYRTSNDATTYIVETYGATPSTNTTVNWVWVKGSGITNYTVSVPSGKGTGYGVSSRVIPTSVMTPEGSSVLTTVDGIQHDLVDLTPIRVLETHLLSSADPPVISNNLSGVLNPVSLRIRVLGARLTNPSTAGAITVSGTDSNGAVINEPVSFSEAELTANLLRLVNKNTTQNFATVTSIVVAGFSSGTFNIGTPSGTLSVQEVQLEFTGTNTEIYEIMLLESVLGLDPDGSFVGIVPSYESNSILQTNIRGGISRIRSLSSRGKWSIDYQALFNSSSPRNMGVTSPNSIDSTKPAVLHDEFLRVVSANPNFVFAQDFNRYPDRVFPATWGDSDLTQSYISRVISAGTIVDFSVRET